MTKTPEQLRHAIDRGASGEKVSFPDPSAAPLGTDEEAAGTPVPARAAEQAYRHEIKGRKKPVAEGSEPLFPWTLLIVIVIVLFLIAFFLLRQDM